MAAHSASVDAKCRAPKSPCVVQYLRVASPTAASQSSKFSRGSVSKLGSMVFELELDDIVFVVWLGTGGEKM